MRRPSPRLTEGLVTHMERAEVSFPKGLDQWAQYGQVLENAGWKIKEIPPPTPSNDSCPDSVFIEDAVVMFGEKAIVTRPGSAERLPEVDNMEELLVEAGLRIQILARITSPGSLDGGDVLKIGNKVFVGHGGRTNEEGIEQLAALLGPSWHVIAVPMSKALHLKSACTALPNGTLVYWPPFLDEQGYRTLNQNSDQPLLAALEEPGAHVVVLDEDTVLMAASAVETAELLRRPPYSLRVVAVDISEYEKLEGCVTCLSVRVRESGDDHASRNG